MLSAILLVLGIAVFLAASVQLFRGRTKKVHWCISCVLAMLLVGNGIVTKVEEKDH